MLSGDVTSFTAGRWLMFSRSKKSRSQDFRQESPEPSFKTWSAHRGINRWPTRSKVNLFQNSALFPNGELRCKERLASRVLGHVTCESCGNSIMPNSSLRDTQATPQKMRMLQIGRDFSSRSYFSFQDDSSTTLLLTIFYVFSEY